MNNTKGTGKCTCNFCEDELKNSCIEPEFCQPCTVEFIECKKCGHKFKKDIKVCPRCARKGK